MRYWWVNHKLTSKFEIAGGFLWSPVCKKDGRRNRFYDNMRLASPGDLVVSYSSLKIAYVGKVQEYARSSPIPSTFGKKGESWDGRNGWILPVQWSKLLKTVRPKDRIAELGPLLPERFSPISPVTGNGRQHAYLAEVGKEIFSWLTENVDLNIALSPVLSTGVEEVFDCIDDVIEKKIVDDMSIDATTRLELIAARRGQGIFKKRIYEFENGCRLTQIRTSSLLIASHIKPWRLCGSAQERLDGANGLLLAPHVDLLFDRGLISFEDDGSVVLSSRLSLTDFQLLGLDLSRLRGAHLNRRSAFI
jgi:hypothetical protein